MLPDDLQAQLNLARFEASGGIQFTRRAGSKRSRPAEYRFIIDGRQIVRGVQDVEHLCPELHIEGLRNPADVIVVEDHEIEVREARPGQGVASVVAKEILAVLHPAWQLCW